MQTKEEAKRLAQTMIEIGQHLGKILEQLFQT